MVIIVLLLSLHYHLLGGPFQLLALKSTRAMVQVRSEILHTWLDVLCRQVAQVGQMEKTVLR